MTKTYKSDALSAIHETVSDLHDIGVVSKKTLKQFDKKCLAPIHEFSAVEIKQLRQKEGVSQTVFAHYLNVSPDSIRNWEQGVKNPAGPSLKLLSLVEKKGLEAIT